MMLLLREIGRSCRGGEASEEEPLQYADYAEWRGQLLARRAGPRRTQLDPGGEESGEPRPSALLFGAPGEGTVAPKRLRLTLRDEEVAALRRRRRELAGQRGALPRSLRACARRAAVR